MKILSFIFAFICALNIQAQTRHVRDTIDILLDHEDLKEMVVLDEWNKEHAVHKTPSDHQLELQLRQLKGINLISRGSFAQEVVFRGQADGRIQVKLNGMRIYSACTDRMDPVTSYVAANNLSTADVTSACKSHCENSGLAGNLNMKLKTPVFDDEHKLRWGFIQQYLTNTNGFNSAFNLESNSQKFAWRLNGSFLKNHNYIDGNGNEIAFSQNQKQNWALNTVYRISPKQFVNLDLIFDLATDVGYPALPMDVSRARALIGGITYHSYKPLGPFNRFDVKIYHNDIFHEMDDSKRDVFMRMDMPGWSRTSGINLDAHHWTIGKHNISASAEYYTNFRRAEMTMYPNDESANEMFMLTWADARVYGSGLGVGHSYHFGKNMLNTTLRFDHEISSLQEEVGRKQWTGMGYDLTKGRQYLLPKIRTALTHNLSDKNSLIGAVSYGLRAPTTSELYGFYLFNAHDGFDYLGNPDLNPESLITAEMGYKYKDEKWEIFPTIFVQHYRDYIFGLNTSFDAMTYGAKGVRAYENIEGATFYGLELEGKYKPSEAFSTNFKLDYLRGLKKDENLPMIPPLQGIVSVNYHWKKIIISGQGRMAMEQTQYNSNYGDRYTPGYALLDLAVGRDFMVKNVKIRGEIAGNNLLNSYYREHLNLNGIPSLGRNIIFKLQVSN